MFLLKVAHVFQLIQNEHSAFSIHNEKQNMKIIKRASWQHKAEVQQRAGFKLWQFIHYENERNTHISYSCCNHKIFSSYFYLDLDSLQLLSKTSSQFRFKATLKVHTFTLSWMWAAIPSIQRRKFGCGCNLINVNQPNRIPKLSSHFDFESRENLSRVTMHKKKSRKMLGMTTKISIIKRATPKCQPEIFTLYLTTPQNRLMQYREEKVI